jgi:hypothetical protein
MRWTRLEPSSRDPELTLGLEGRVHDPLWLLGRQWQLGEFEAVDGGSVAVAEITDDTAAPPRTLVPRPVSFPGMPARHLWEFEDARLVLAAQPEDLGRLLLREVAHTYGGDWLVVALDAPSGGVIRLQVRDTFGHTTTSRSVL